MSSSGTASGDASLPTAEILAVMTGVKDDQVPTTPEERENYFMSQVAKGEQLCIKGAPTLPGCRGSTITYCSVKGPSLLLRPHWHSLGPFGFIPPRSN